MSLEWLGSPVDFVDAWFIHCVLWKRFSPCFCCNLKTRSPILVILDRNVNDKLRNQKPVYFPKPTNYFFHCRFKTDKRGNCMVSLRPTCYVKIGFFGPFFVRLERKSKRKDIAVLSLLPAVDSRNSCLLFSCICHLLRSMATLQQSSRECMKACTSAVAEIL